MAHFIPSRLQGGIMPCLILGRAAQCWLIRSSLALGGHTSCAPMWCLYDLRSVCTIASREFVVRAGAAWALSFDLSFVTCGPLRRTIVLCNKLQLGALISEFVLCLGDFPDFVNVTISF